VIVVTHDISLLQKYVTRKLHLYDGEIMEDSELSIHTVNALQDVTPKLSHTTILGSLKIAFRNVFSVPKKSLFSLLTITFMLAMIFFIYSSGLLEINKSISSTNPYFTNTDPSRIILIKNDKTSFTPEELLEISQVNNVRGVYENDMVFDSVLVTKIFSEELATNIFYYFKPLPALALDGSRLIEGNLPVNASEVVIGNNGLFNIGDKISIANDYLLFPTQDLETDQFEFIVSGIIEEPANLDDDLHYFYLSNAGLAKISMNSIYENSEISIRIEGTRVYDTPTDTWITPNIMNTVETKTKIYEISYPTWVRIDNSIADNQILTFDMMYFDICRDFGYKAEVADDSDAGLCDANAFIGSHNITYRAITTFENNQSYEEISFISTPYTSDDQSLKLYMNETTFSRFFDESGYQITVIVRGSFEGNQVVKELVQLGYNTLYPSQIIDSNQALMIVINNILVTLIFGVLIIAVCFVGHFVINKLLISKLTDYLIIRFIGASKMTVKRIVQFEILFITIISALLLLIFIILAKQNIFVIEDTLRYYKWKDFLFLIIIVLCVMEIMVVQFTRKVFKASVVSALKGAE
jgi:hypothetical protein